MKSRLSSQKVSNIRRHTLATISTKQSRTDSGKSKKDEGMFPWLGAAKMAFMHNESRRSKWIKNFI